MNTPAERNSITPSEAVWAWLEDQDPDWAAELGEQARRQGWPERAVGESDWHRLCKLAPSFHPAAPGCRLSPEALLLAGGSAAGWLVGFETGLLTVLGSMAFLGTVLHRQSGPSARVIHAGCLVGMVLRRVLLP